MSLEVPLNDFEYLPRHYNCSLQRSASELVLAASSPGCALTFAVVGDLARLTRVEVRDDETGAFSRDVVVPLFVMYGGDLEAVLEWNPAVEEPSLVIRKGQTWHPFLEDGHTELPDPQDDLSLAMIEQWLADSHAAWGEYLRLRQARTRSLTG